MPVVVLTCLLALFLTSCGSSDDAAAGSESASWKRIERAAIEKYRWYLEENIRELVDWSTQLRGQIVAGELEKAQSRYATSRVQFSQLEPAAELFDELTIRVDAQAGEVAPGEFPGFHRIEKALFADSSTEGMAPVAKTLLADIGQLGHELKVAQIGPLQIAQGASEVLNEVSTSKIAGKTEPYSGTAFVDIAANVEGAEAVFEVLRPRLASLDQALVERLEARFVEAYDALREAGQAAREPQARARAAGAVFVIYDEFNAAGIRALSTPLKALAETFAEVPGQIEASRP